MRRVPALSFAAPTLGLFARQRTLTVGQLVSIARLASSAPSLIC
jgi:hypothetical protein